MPSGEEETIFLCSLHLVPSQLEGINLILDLECVSNTLIKGVNKIENCFIHHPCIFVIDIPTCYAEKPLGLKYGSVSVNCELRL